MKDSDFRRFLYLLCGIPLVLGLACGEPGPREMPLQLGRAELRGGDQLTTELALAAGEMVRLEVMQDGVDVALTLAEAGAEEALWKADSPYETQGPDELLYIAAKAGAYRLSVEAPASASTGFVEVVEVYQRPAGERDRAWVAADHRFREGRELYKLGNRTGEEGYYAEATEKLGEALTAFRELEMPRREAEALDALGFVYERLPGAEAAELGIAHFHQAADLFGQADLPWRQAVALHWAGVLLSGQSRFEEAITDFEAAFDLYREMGKEDEAGSSLARLGVTYRRMGRMERALLHLERALELAQGKDRAAHLGVLNDLAATKLALNRPAEALPLFEKCLDLLEDGELTRERTLALEGRIEALARSGDLPGAGRAAAEVRASLGDGELAAEQVNLLLAVGRLHRRRGELVEAREVFDRGVSEARRLGETQKVAVALLEGGVVRVRLGEAEEGLDRIREAARLSAELGDAQLSASANARMGEALEELGRHGEALIYLEKALAGVEEIRTSTGRRDVRLDYFGFRQEYFDLALDIRMHLHDLEPEAGHHIRALELDERRRAQELLGRLEGASEEQVKIPRTLMEEHGRLESLLVDAAAEKARGERLDDLLRNLHRVRAAMDGRRSEGTVSPTRIEVDSFCREELRDGSVVLAVRLGEEQSYLWIVAADRPVEVYRLPPKEEIEEASAAFLEAVLGGLERRRGGHAADFREIGEPLSELLLGHVPRDLHSRRWVFVLDETLHALPLGALPDPAEPERLLIEGRELVVIPSMAGLRLIRAAEEARPRPPEEIAAFGDPVFRADDRRFDTAARQGSAQGMGAASRAAIHRLTERTGGELLRRLPHSRQEVERLKELTKGDDALIALGFEATRSRFLDLSPGRYRLLHLATHAVSDLARPELSAIVLSMVDEDGQPVDGIVWGFEISARSLPFELVTLSACETGVGKHVPGEGVLALSRGFLEAGTSRVVASLWRVRDDKTARLMSHFYDAYLREGMAPGAALRAAQLRMLKEPDSSHPHFWAGFVLYGDWTAPRR